MFKENVTNSFYFGAKVKFTKDNVHADFKDKEFCLIGFTDTAFAVILWEKRGEYNLDFISGSIYSDLELVV